eukprot:2723003-Pyramimonas_sp.AAC.1
MVARYLSPAVRTYRFGDYWGGIVIHGVIFLTSQILHHLVDGGRAETAIQGMSAFIEETRAMYPATEFHTVVGSDMNVQLPAHFEELTGGAAWRDQRRCDQNKCVPVLSFMQSSGLRALNTYTDEAAFTWKRG